MKTDPRRTPRNTKDVGDQWETPQWVFRALDAEFQFAMDAACTVENNKVKRSAPLDDGLAQHWHGNVFVNPPYSDPGAWVNKAVIETERSLPKGKTGAAVVVMLLPASTDTRWFRQAVYYAKEIRFITGRLKFEYQGQAHYPARSGSVIVIFKRDRKRWRTKPKIKWVTLSEVKP